MVLSRLRRNKVTIYQFTAWDPAQGMARKSTRWGTRRAIETVVRGTVLEGTGVEVDAADVRSDIPGLTTVGYTPPER